VFSNNARGYGRHSNIIAIDPRTFEYETHVDGSKYDFYSRANGMHEIAEFGTVIVTSSTQGRAFEVGRNGEVVFDFVTCTTPARTKPCISPRSSS
jgi:hypothetical protein